MNGWVYVHAHICYVVTHAVTDQDYMGGDTICEVGEGGVMIIAREACEKFLPIVS